LATALLSLSWAPFAAWPARSWLFEARGAGLFRPAHPLLFGLAAALPEPPELYPRGALEEAASNDA
jgi:hypothetical protein